MTATLVQGGRGGSMMGLSSQMASMQMRPNGGPNTNLSVGAAEFVPRNDFHRGPPPPPPHRFGPPPPNYTMPHHAPPPPRHAHDFAYPISPQQFLSSPGSSYNSPQQHYYDPYSSAQPSPAAQWGQAPPPPMSQAMPTPDPKKMHFYMEIQIGAEQVITEPDKFEDFAEAIRDRILVEGELTELDVETICGTLLNMAVNVPHVSYPLAKLCAYLVGEMEGQTGEAGNWSLFLSRIWRREHSERAMTHSAAPERLRLFAIFLAELFANVRTAEGNHDLDYGRGVLEQCETLIAPSPDSQAQTDENLKTIVRILKCCGGDLERLKIDGGSEINFTPRLSALISGLQSLCSNSSVSEGVKKSVGAVVALREAGWGKRGGGDGGGGRVEEVGEVEYGPDGQQLSEEERAFLSEAFGSVAESVLRSSVDDEADSAYEEFLKSQNS